ncbi:MAG TPA: lysophospholipid acyltransferase family protein [Gemmatimonadales bacterium]|jgi:1-acyl-sn-glycerol-3-phosphate acyltransferase
MPSPLSSIRNAVATTWTWSVLALMLILVLVPIVLLRLLAWPFDRVNYVGGRLFRLVGVATVKLTPRWRFSVRGTLPSNPRNPYVVVANHESFADMLLLCHLPWEMKWLAKIEFLWIPVLGWLMWAVRDVVVHRGRAASAKLAMAACAERLAGRVSVMMFPEGTRAPTREMLPFKDGAFRLAIESGVPILPLATYGTRNAIARRAVQINPAIAVVEVLEPEPTAGVELPELKRRVRARIEAARERLRQELEQPPAS